MVKKSLLVFGIIISALVTAFIGMIVAALIGGNYVEQFVFNGVQGYEATGQIGFILGAVIGGIISWRFLWHQKKEI